MVVLPAREPEYRQPQHASLLQKERDELTPGGSPATLLSCLGYARIVGRLRRDGGWRPLLDSGVFRMVFWELFAASCRDAYGPQLRVDCVCRSISRSCQPQVGFGLVHMDWGALSHVAMSMSARISPTKSLPDLQEYRLPSLQEHRLQYQIYKNIVRSTRISSTKSAWSSSSICCSCTPS